MDLLPSFEGRSMIPMDLSADCNYWIYDPERIRDPDPWDQISGSVLGIHAHLCLQHLWTTTINLHLHTYMHSVIFRFNRIIINYLIINYLIINYLIINYLIINYLIINYLIII